MVKKYYIQSFSPTAVKRASLYSELEVSLFLSFFTQVNKLKQTGATTSANDIFLLCLYQSCVTLFISILHVSTSMYICMSSVCYIIYNILWLSDCMYIYTLWINYLIVCIIYTIFASCLN